MGATPGTAHSMTSLARGVHANPALQHARSDVHAFQDAVTSPGGLMVVATSQAVLPPSGVLLV